MAAKQLYIEFRNPLVHELDAEKITSARQPCHIELTVGKWGKIPTEHRSIDQIDNRGVWYDKWAALYVMENENGEGLNCRFILDGKKHDPESSNPRKLN